jgi:tetraacyldisaccharide 4'-kinase
MAFGGIASPEGFKNFLLRSGTDIVYKNRFVDHHRFSKNELANIFNIACAKGAAFAVTTEKDAVRLPKDFEARIPTYFVKTDIEIISGEEIFEEAVSKFDSLPRLSKGETTS